ncbi:WD40 repeat-like protein [Pholiota conissans]|uniref:WD40 repeat-like protein n=1 Tax=Pholiota conissans TaxID=109636 RepID=A0A9P5ZEF2_9AGAR|nr:WD40 repeat-like protein [Pholiota conissans]
MIQTGLIQNAHGDLVTDASYDFYGLRLATCSLDQRIKIWQLDENNTWNVEDDWKAHDAAVSKLSWAHPEFGSIIASGSFDRTVKIWEQSSISQADMNGSGASIGQQGSRWVERAVLSDAKGTIRTVEFAPHHFGLKLATLSTDNILRIYEPLEQPSLATWTLSDEIDIQAMALGPSPQNFLSRAQTMALATPTQTHATLEGASASLVAQALQQAQSQGSGGSGGGGSGTGAGTAGSANGGGAAGAQGASGSATNTSGRAGQGNREADGGWCISWCKDKYWGEVIAAGCGTSGVVKIIQLNARRSSTLLTLSSSPSTAIPASTVAPAAAPESSAPAESNARPANGSQTPPPAAITSVSWAPSCGRSYHLIATGGRDGHVRIWKVRPGLEDAESAEREGEYDAEDSHWTAVSVADFDHHKAAVGRVEWNITGTVLSSAGNDGRVRLWKATAGNVWRPAGSVGVEQTEEAGVPESKDVEMEG